MTMNECKKDVKKRLEAHGIAYTKLTGKTVSFEGFGYGSAIFITIYGADFPEGVWDKVFEGKPKPSAGGYVADVKR